MEAAKDVLRNALRKLGDPKAAHAWLAANWPMIAGERMAIHARPLSLHDGVFRIQTDSVAWKRQVEGIQAAICERINRAWGSSLVHRVRVEDAPRQGARQSRAEDNRHTPFIRARKAERHEDQ